MPAVRESVVPAPLRKCFRRLLRGTVAVCPGRVNRLIARLPYSRFHRLIPQLLSGYEVIRWRGLRVRVNPAEGHGFYHYLWGNINAAEIEAVIDRCRQCRAAVFADVGANQGLFALAVARACPDLQVEAFEPDGANCLLFRENLALNPDLQGRVRLHEVAVSDVDGRVRFQAGWDGGTGSSEVGRVLQPSERASGGRELVSVRLDRFFQAAPTVLKIDVEGHELHVLRGMKGWLAAPRALLLEIHASPANPDWQAVSKAEVAAVLRPFGYRFSALIDGAWQPADEVARWPDYGNVLADLPGGPQESPSS